MFKAIESQESAKDRETRIATAILNANNAREIAQLQADAESDGNLLNDLLNFGKTVGDIASLIP